MRTKSPKAKVKPATILRFDAARMQRARVECGLTLQNVADKCGVFASAVQRWETGFSEPYKRRVKQLAKVLRIPIRDLYIEVANK